jgi:hypothetical protein
MRCTTGWSGPAFRTAGPAGKNAPSLDSHFTAGRKKGDFWQGVTAQSFRFSPFMFGTVG